MRFRWCLTLMLLVCVVDGRLYAQSFTGGVRGTVKDVSGVLPNAAVMLISEQTGVARQTVSNSAGEYSFPVVDPGTYKIDNGGGGADIGAFTATLNVPPQFMWTNADAALSIDRSAGIDIIWTGGDPDSKVNIQGTVAVTNATTRMLEAGGVFTCMESNSAGHFFVSPEVMKILPATTTVNGVSNGTLSVSDGVEVKFNATGSDLSLFSYRSGTTRSPEYK